MACVVSDGKALTRTRANLIGKRTTQQHAAYSSKNGKGSKPNSFFFKPPTPILKCERENKKMLTNSDAELSFSRSSAAFSSFYLSLNPSLPGHCLVSA